jgi:hypothetical protein
VAAVGLDASAADRHQDDDVHRAVETMLAWVNAPPPVASASPSMGPKPKESIAALTDEERHLRLRILDWWDEPEQIGCDVETTLNVWEIAPDSTLAAVLRHDCQEDADPPPMGPKPKEFVPSPLGDPAEYWNSLTDEEYPSAVQAEEAIENGRDFDAAASYATEALEQRRRMRAAPRPSRAAPAVMMLRRVRGFRAPRRRFSRADRRADRGPPARPSDDDHLARPRALRRGGAA